MILLLILLVLVLILILLLLLLLLLKQSFGEGVVELGILVIRIAAHSPTIGGEGLLVLFLCKLGIAKVVRNLATLLLAATLVVHNREESLLGLLVTLGTVECRSKVVLRLERRRVVTQRLLIALDTALNLLLGILAVTSTHPASLLHLLCRGLTTSEHQKSHNEIFHYTSHRCTSFSFLVGSSSSSSTTSQGLVSSTK